MNTIVFEYMSSVYECYPSLEEVRHSRKNDLFSRTFPRVTDSHE